MAVQNGRDLLIKMDMTGDGSFVTVAGLRATRLSFNAESVDVTSMDSPGGWQLIGRTTTVMFDPAREPASLLAPGDLVRFVPVERA